MINTIYLNLKTRINPKHFNSLKEQTNIRKPLLATTTTTTRDIIQPSIDIFAIYLRNPLPTTQSPGHQQTTTLAALSTLHPLTHDA